MPTSKVPPDDPLSNPALSESVRALARRGEIRRYRKGTLLIQEGDGGDTIYIILRGQLRAFSSHPSNGREIIHGTYGPGEYVGEMGLDGGLRSASVIAMGPCECSIIGRPTLERYIADNPAFAFELLDKVIRRARAATLSVKRLALNDVYGRIKSLLDPVAEPQPDGTRLIRDRLTHLETARHIGCTREMVSRVMKDLETGGYVEVSGDDLRLLRPLPARW